MSKRRAQKSLDAFLFHLFVDGHGGFLLGPVQCHVGSAAVDIHAPIPR